MELSGSGRSLRAAALVAVLAGTAAAPLPGADGAPAPPAAPGARPDAWGTVLTTYVVIDGAELSPRNSGIGVGCIQNCQLRYSTSLVPDPFQAAVHLPAGAYLTSMEIDYYDGSAAGQVSASFAVCDPSGVLCEAQAGGCPGATVCSGDPDAPGFSSSSADVSADGIGIDNLLHRYVVVAGNSTTDGSTSISQIILGYVRQVSPPPAFASFNDVPTSHPLFQFVEALAASGITAGCGGGRFCPTAPLTRGQMAVFLAKALGLQWN